MYTLIIYFIYVFRNISEKMQHMVNAIITLGILYFTKGEFSPGLSFSGLILSFYEQCTLKGEITFVKVIRGKF